MRLCCRRCRVASLLAFLLAGTGCCKSWPNSNNDDDDNNNNNDDDDNYLLELGILEEEGPQCSALKAGHISDPNAGVAQQPPDPGSSCPRNRGQAEAVAKSVAALLWVGARCQGHFPEETVVPPIPALRSRRGGCEVRLPVMGGELRLLLDMSLLLGGGSDGATTSWWPPPSQAVLAASVRTGSWGIWGKASGRLCLLSPVAGAVQVPQPSAAAQDFALRALNANRALRQCGEPLSLVASGAVSSGHVPATSSILGRAVVLHFHMELELQSGSGAGNSFVVQLALERYSVPSAAGAVSATNNNSNGNSKSSNNNKYRESSRSVFQFLGSRPDACELAPTPQQQASFRAATSSATSPFSAAMLAVAPVDLAREAEEEEAWLMESAASFSSRVLRSMGLQDVPYAFSFVESAPGCLMPVRRQGRCVGGWALAAAGSLEKQACVLSKQTVRPRLSAQRVVDCAGQARGGCLGGSLKDAFHQMFREGAVAEECLPWSAPEGLDALSQADLQFPAESYFEPEGFVPSLPPSRLLSNDAQASNSNCAPLPAECERLQLRTPGSGELGLWPGRLPWGAVALRGERLIQAAILAYAAVASVVEVYLDFLQYRSGVYRLDEGLASGDLRGLTAVQLLGWGADDHGAMFWRGENSFGPDWGEKGYFRWIRGEDHLGIEQHAVLGLVAGLLPLGASGRGPSPRSEEGLEFRAIDRFAELREKISVLEGSLDEIALETALLAAFAAAAWAAVVVAVKCLLCPQDQVEERDDEKLIGVMRQRPWQPDAESAESD
ncbi:unnamed protein product [Polarella glacialis]|uniref:Peptidase C1A papain C-terminal domain-containing protein n=1 Tax=Polarella glacialis TaxID=89957 RepID=A0A813IYX4_POLGL|nr:unnamed protein product [Polarella glacialis]